MVIYRSYDFYLANVFSDAIRLFLLFPVHLSLGTDGVFVLSSYGMVAPVQGGVGAWHFMVIAALMIYLPHTEEIASLSKTFALLTHGTMTLLYIVVGVLCLLFLPIYNRK